MEQRFSYRDRPGLNLLLRVYRLPVPHRIATASTTYNDPFNLARRFASLDYISGGRAGWNIVTTATKGVVAITNAKIFPIAKPAIDRGTIVVRDGIIEAVGAGVSVPSGAQVIDAAGAEVYPGFINARSTRL